MVVTHCGFGGLNETIAAGKPLVALPFRADQPANAKLSRARGLGEVLSPPKLTAAAVTSAVGKADPDVCVQQQIQMMLLRVASQVLANPSYATKALELQQSMLKTGGAEACWSACHSEESLAQNPLHRRLQSLTKQL